MTDKNGNPEKINGHYQKRKVPPICKRCPREQAVDLTEENEEIYRRYLLITRCGMTEYAEGIDPYLLSLIADTEIQAQKTIMESAIRSALDGVL